MLLPKLPSKVLSSLLSVLLASQAGMAQVATTVAVPLAVPQAVVAPVILDPSEQIRLLTTEKTFIRAGSTLFETDDLAKVYGLRNNLPIWTANGVATGYALALKNAIITLSTKHGLIASDYWTEELESYLATLNVKTAPAFEMAATHSLLQFATHLSDGRMDPYSIDDDVRFTKRVFLDHLVVAQSVAGTPGMIAGILETLAPQHKFYTDTVAILAQLRSIKATGGFAVMKKAFIKLGQKHASVPAIRDRMKQYGYTFTTEGDIYDQELSAAVQEMQTEHGFEVNANLKLDSGFWGVMVVPVDQRITQAEATLEKLRWLPKVLETNMIFVNTNSTEVKIIEDNQVINEFRSINGRVLRRTPMMKTWITKVIFNPRWVATDSIVLQDKLPLIQANPNYLSTVRMKMFTHDGQEVDPTSLNWNRNGHQIARSHMFVMDPGPKNALGTFKFPLAPDRTKPHVSNADAIFMHFTDDSSLFSKPNARHLSSGCIRLEKAQWLAGYLLKNNPEYDANAIQALIAKGIPGETFQTDKAVMLSENDQRAVYTVPLTVEKTKSGRPRFLKDHYLSDRRIVNAVMAQNLRMARAQSTVASTNVISGIRVIGQAGATQQFANAVAIRCDGPEFGSNSKTGMRTINRRCDQPVNFALNTKQALPAGNYIVAFENTIYPGFVTVNDFEITTIQLQKISVPKSFAKENSVKIYRDFSSLVEQKKVLFEKFFYGKNIFRQTIRKFGDFYLAGLTDIDTAPQANFAYCSENAIDKLRLVTDIREHAKYVCESYNQAQTMMDMSDLYRFSTNGTFQEAAVDYPGDIIPKRHLRYLVATPMKTTDFVSVMPGVYRIHGESNKNSRATTASITENYPELTRTFANSQNKGEADDIDLVSTVGGAATTADVAAPANTGSGTITYADGRTISISNGAVVEGNVNQPAVRVGKCAEARVWRTEKRSYCSQDSMDGCDRAVAVQCSEMKLDLRFRK